MRLVHIGLPKACSTSLQGQWRRSQHISISYFGLLDFIEKCRLEAKGVTVDEPQLTSDEDMKEHHILTHEALSCPEMNQGASRYEVEQYQRLASRLGGKALLVTREPVSWVKSMYNQSVKQGGTYSFDEFLEIERDFLLQTYNISFLREIWDLLVLPMDLYVNDPASFHAEVERFSGIPAPETAPIKSHGSIDEHYLDMFLSANVMLKKMTDAGFPDNELTNHFRFQFRGFLEGRPDIELPVTKRCGIHNNIPFIDELRDE